MITGLAIFERDSSLSSSRGLNVKFPSPFSIQLRLYVSAFCFWDNDFVNCKLSKFLTMILLCNYLKEIYLC